MRISGNIYLKGDKSITHRAIMLASICNGESIVNNVPQSEDILSTINALSICGIKTKNKNENLSIIGNTFKHPSVDIDCGNSGTSIRLMAGLLSSKKIRCRLVGDKSLSRRPMDRIVNPMRKLGFDILSTQGCAPIQLQSFEIQKDKEIHISIPSAQVKSALIFSSLIGGNKIKISEKYKTRDHLERLINSINNRVLKISNNEITINHTPEQEWKGFEINLPGDISSASYFIAAATLLPGSELVINNVLLNNRRLGFIKSLIKMGANILISDEVYRHNERIGKLTIIGVEKLAPINVPSEDIPGMVDEVPILSLVCSYASGTSIISGLDELRYKESDRLEGILNILTSMGVDIKISGSDIAINGKNKLYNTTKLNNYDDHRLAMMISIAQLIARDRIEYPDCINISFPDFKELLNKVII